MRRLMILLLVLSLCCTGVLAEEAGQLIWYLDGEGILHIGGTGYIAAFASPEEQPWRDVREQIYYAVFDIDPQPEYESLEHWFTDCVNLLPENIITEPIQTFASCSHFNAKYFENGCMYYEVCMDCSTLLEQGEAHDYSYSAWTYHSSTLHKRSYICPDCNDSGTDYGSHDSTFSTISMGSSTHASGYYCADCETFLSGGSEASHSLSYGSWSNYSGTQHRRKASCSACGYSTSETENHNIVIGAWEAVSETEHVRANACVCGYGTEDSGSHADTNSDSYCDDCGYLMSRFSVTVPASLDLVISEWGEVYAATDAVIVNESTDTVAVTALEVRALGNWTLVPYGTNMAAVPVDAQQIGFAVNGSGTTLNGFAESLALSDNWTIAAGESLPLMYDAVISASSYIITDEPVLELVFVVDWAR